MPVPVPDLSPLHGTYHAAESAGVEPVYAAVSVVVVGLGGGLLYWYYGRQVAAE